MIARGRGFLWVNRAVVSFAPLREIYTHEE